MAQFDLQSLNLALSPKSLRLQQQNSVPQFPIPGTEKARKSRGKIFKPKFITKTQKTRKVLWGNRRTAIFEGGNEIPEIFDAHPRFQPVGTSEKSRILRKKRAGFLEPLS
jgi:hypothetical protein